MENKNRYKIVIKGFFWRFIERAGAQMVAIIVQIVLARILSPKDFGVVALVTVFITFVNVFVDSGFANALIQKKEPDDTDFSTVFYFNIALCLLLYLCVFLLAPIVATIYHENSLTSIIRVLAITILISGFKNVQQAYVAKNLLFKKFFYSTLGGTIGAAVVGIGMALFGFGVWALVFQHLFNVFVDTIILWITVKWRPKRIFSMKRLRSLFDYGWKMLAASLLDTTYNEVRQLIIGGKYSTESLAFYNRGDLFPRGIINNIDESINSVLLPTMASVQDDNDKVREITSRAIKTSTYIISPLMMGMAFTGKTFIRVLLTEKWLPCVPFLTIFCITYMFYPVHTANLNAIKALGRSDLFFGLEILKKIVGIIALLISYNISVLAMACSLLFVSLACQIINSWPNKKLLSYSYYDQLKDILPNILLSVLMGIVIWMLSSISLPAATLLLLQVLVGCGIYILLSKITHNDSYGYIKKIIKELIIQN